MVRTCATLIAGTILALLLTSCGGSEDHDPEPPPPAAAQPASPPAATPTPTAEAEESSDSEAADGGAIITVTEGSEALYRINEQLARRDLPNDAVGTTSEIEGQIVFSAAGTVDAERSKITVGVGSLRSDSDRRDSYIQRNSLESGQYPEVTIAVTEIRGLSWPLPTSGEVSFEMAERSNDSRSDSPSHMGDDGDFHRRRCRGACQDGGHLRAVRNDQAARRHCP